jgi:hypothetical protein
MEYVLDCDYDDNWYIIPDNKLTDFLKWIEDDSDNDAPDYVVHVNSNTQVKFSNYRIC